MVLGLQANQSFTLLDVISEYSFGQSANSLDTPELGVTIRKNIETGIRIHPFARVFPRFIRALIKLVDVVAPYLPFVLDVKSYQTMIHDLTRPLFDSAVQGTTTKPSVVRALARSEMLPVEERTLPRIMSEMGGVIGGGTETLGRTVSCSISILRTGIPITDKPPLPSARSGNLPHPVEASDSRSHPA